MKKARVEHLYATADGDVVPNAVEKRRVGAWRNAAAAGGVLYGV